MQRGRARGRQEVGEDEDERSRQARPARAGEKLERPVEAVAAGRRPGRESNCCSIARHWVAIAPRRHDARSRPSTAAKPISAFVTAPLATIIRPASRTAACLSSHGSQSGKSAIEGLRSTTIDDPDGVLGEVVADDELVGAAGRRQAGGRGPVDQADGVAAAIRTRARDLVAGPRRRLGRPATSSAPRLCGTGSAGRRGRRPGSWSRERLGGNRPGTRRALEAALEQARPARPASRRRAP